MSNSRHPIALRLAEHVEGPTRLLATVMGLSLVDGLFVALVLAGALETAVGVLQVGLLVFGGSATFAVILAELDGDPRTHLPTIAAVGAGLIALAAAEAALAPTVRSMLDIAVFERFAALVLLAVSAATVSARVGEYLPRPAVIVGLGLLAAFEPAGAAFVAPAPGQALRGAAAAGVGVAFAAGVALLAPTLRGVVDMDRFRFGSAVALGTLPLSIIDLVPGTAPLAVFAVAGVLAFDPGGVSLPSRESMDEDAAEERPPWL